MIEGAPQSLNPTEVYKRGDLKESTVAGVYKVERLVTSGRRRRAQRLPVTCMQVFQHLLRHSLLCTTHFLAVALSSQKQICCPAEESLPEAPPLESQNLIRSTPPAMAPSMAAHLSMRKPDGRHTLLRKDASCQDVGIQG